MFVYCVRVNVGELAGVKFSPPICGFWETKLRGFLGSKQPYPLSRLACPVCYSISKGYIFWVLPLWKSRFYTANSLQHSKFLSLWIFFINIRPRNIRHLQLILSDSYFSNQSNKLLASFCCNINPESLLNWPILINSARSDFVSYTLKNLLLDYTDSPGLFIYEFKNSWCFLES